MSKTKRDAFFTHFAQSDNGRALLEQSLREAESSLEELNNQLALLNSDSRCYGDNAYEIQRIRVGLQLTQAKLQDSISIFQHALNQSRPDHQENDTASKATPCGHR